MKQVLITGATGFVGSHALEALMQQDDIHVIAACRDKRGLVANFTGEVRVGDLRDQAYVESIVKGVDVIVHAAAWSSLFKHRQQSVELFFEPARALINTAVKQGVKRFINISTTSAAAPEQSSDPMSRGIPRDFWPHLSNLVAIEDLLWAKSTGATTMVNLRCGIFAGRRYGLGVLPILLPRLKTHLVPWVAGGKTGLPIIDGRDIGEAVRCAVMTEGLSGFEGFNIVGPETPSVAEVIEFLHTRFGYPKPHFSVPFAVAYPFAGLMELLDPLSPFDPLVTRSIIHLLEETGATNQRATERLGYQPQYHWQEAVSNQVEEMRLRQRRAMRMVKLIEV